MQYLDLVWVLFFASCMLLRPYDGSAQCGLQSGPMNGYSEMVEAMVWVQTKCPQSVRMRYWPDSDTSQIHFTRVVQTDPNHGNTAHLLADEVTPGNTYHYEILIDDEVVRLPYKTTFRTQELWQYEH